MSRLPEFFAGLSPLREILHALDDELEQMRNQVDVKNVQTMLSGEDRSLITAFPTRGTAPLGWAGSAPRWPERRP